MASASMPGSIIRWLWLLGGCLAFVLGVVGVILPLLPTTPFIILAAFCFSKSVPSWQAWLERNKLFGPIITGWNAHGAIAPKYKAIALSMMLAVLLLSVFKGLSATIIVIQAVCITGAACFILTRPSGP